MRTDLSFVFDTNVIVSALLLKQSVARQAFDKGAALGKLLISPATIQELAGVLRRKDFDKYILEDERIQFITALAREATLIETVEAINECRDPKDDKFLELGVAGRATCIISGDEDLLVLHPFRGIPILTPRQFMDSTFEPQANLATG